MKELTVKSIPLYDGKIIKVSRNLVLLQNDKLAFREIVKHKQGVCIIPVLDDEVLFVKQYRSGAEKVLLELPAGLIDDNETPLDAALRELQEEIKYSSTKITYLGCYYSSPGFTNELIHLYLAEDLFKSSLNEDEDEFIEIEYIELDKVIDMINKGVIKDAKTICLISKYILANHK